MRPGVPFMEVVDPSVMEVQVPVNQEDLLSLADRTKGAGASGRLLRPVLPGQLESVDPMGTPGDFSNKVRNFSANVLNQRVTIPRLMPDLSAAVDVEPGRWTASQWRRGRCAMKRRLRDMWAKRRTSVGCSLWSAPVGRLRCCTLLGQGALGSDL